MIFVVGLRQVALLGQFFFILGPRSRKVAPAGADVEDGYALGGKDALNQVCQLRARRLMQVDEQRAAAQLVKLLHRRPLQLSLPRGDLLA